MAPPAISGQGKSLLPLSWRLPVWNGPFYLKPCGQRTGPGRGGGRWIPGPARKVPGRGCEVLAQMQRLSTQWRVKCLALFGQWQCPDSVLGLVWKFPEVSLYLKLNVGQMQPFSRQSSFVVCLSMHPTIHPFLNQRKRKLGRNSQVLQFYFFITPSPFI